MPFFVILLILSLLSPIYVSSHTNLNHLVISEIQAGGGIANDEFIELLNPTDCPVSIDGWKLTKKSSSGNESNLSASLSGVVPAHGFFLITPQTGFDGGVTADAFYSQTSSFIAATDNTVVLYGDQAKTVVVDKVGFGSTIDFEGTPAANPPTDGSLERLNGEDTDNNSVDLTTRTTSDPQNSSSPLIAPPESCSSPPPSPPPPSPPPPSPPSDVEGTSIVTVAEARQVALDKLVTTSGIVTVLPGRLSASYFYIQDETAGIQIYSSKKSFPTITIGQRVEVTGETSEAYKERRLKIADAGNIVGIGSGEVQPKITKTGSIGESNEGQLVKLTGTVTQTSGDTFYLNDESGEARIYIKEETSIDKPRTSKGVKVTVVGIVSQYNDTYRVLPRTQNDLIVGEEDNENGSASEGSIGVAGSSNIGNDPALGVPVVFGRKTSTPPASTTLPRYPQMRMLGLGGVILGALLLLLVPLMIWEKRSGWLRNRLSRPKDSSRE